MNPENSQLVPQSAELSQREEPSIACMLQAMVEKGITSDSVQAFSQLCALKERMEAKQAEREFAQALVNLQGETIRVPATKKVDVKSDGTCRYKFAAYEEIMALVQPMLSTHGFSITFDTEVGEQRLTSVCTLTHKSGHSRVNRFAVRYGKPPGSSEAQGDMSTKSYAKRGALCDALNISIEHDTDGDDARSLGGPITKAQAEDLRARVKATAADQAKFLAFADAATFEEIDSSKLPQLDEVLRKREAKGSPRKDPLEELKNQPDLM